MIHNGISYYTHIQTQIQIHTHAWINVLIERQIDNQRDLQIKGAEKYYRRTDAMLFIKPFFFAISKKAGEGWNRSSLSSVAYRELIIKNIMAKKTTTKTNSWNAVSQRAEGQMISFSCLMSPRVTLTRHQEQYSQKLYDRSFLFCPWFPPFHMSKLVLLTEQTPKSL